MIQELKDELSKEVLGPFHEKVLADAKGHVKMSRSVMSRYYDNWDMQDRVYHGERCLDADDIEQSRKGKPTKMVVANTFAQVMTFTSFLFLMFTQNRTFFELTPTGDEDYGTKYKDCEAVLQHNLRRNSWNTVLFQHLLDISRFGPAVLECSWTRDIVHAKVAGTENVININGQKSNVYSASGYQDFVKYEGNLVRNVSPYRFFPDTRHPLVDFQRGEFCACEEEYSRTQLKRLEAAGEVTAIDRIAPLNKASDTSRLTRGLDFQGACKDNGPVIVTKCQQWIVPEQYKYGPDDKQLGPENFPVLYHIWYANDNRVIRCEPAEWWHNQFGWTIGQFTPDMHQTLTSGLADLVYRLQDVISWFVNSHITSVRRVMQNRLVVDPAGVETKTLDGEGDIYLRKSASKSGVDRWVKQLQVQDVTGGHMGDVDMLGRLMEVVTGVNGNAMGQYSSGRRSAREAGNVAAGSSGRMKLHGHLIFEGSLAPLAGMMLANNRQSLTMDSFGRIVGGDPTALNDRYTLFQGTPQEVICGDDFFTFDSTMSSEKGFIAQALQELVVTIMSNPMAAQQFDLDPRAMIDEIQFLRGAGNISRFSLSKRVAAGQAAPLPMPVPQQLPA